MENDIFVELLKTLVLFLSGEQLAVTFAAGYIAGVFCAIVSHPADTVVSKLNNAAGSTPLQAAKELGMLNITLFGPP